MGPGGVIHRTLAPLIISMLPQALLTLACLRVSSCVEAELHTCALCKRGRLPAKRRRKKKKNKNVTFIVQNSSRSSFQRHPSGPDSSVLKKKNKSHS